MGRYHTYMSHGIKPNGKTSRGSINRDGSRHDGITSVQSSMMAAIEKMSCVVLLNNNTTNVNSPTFSSVDGEEYRWC